MIMLLANLLAQIGADRSVANDADPLRHASPPGAFLPDSPGPTYFGGVSALVFGVGSDYARTISYSDASILRTVMAADSGV
jgi:hypothetical protein